MNTALQRAPAARPRVSVQPSRNVACVSGSWSASGRGHAAARRRGPAPMAAQKKQFGSFEEMLAGSEVPLLVDFYATWCGPCQMLAPVLSSLSKRMEGKIQVVKIDTERYPGLASKYSVTALPTVILFRDGKPLTRIEGLLDEQQMFDRVTYFLSA